MSDDVPVGRRCAVLAGLDKLDTAEGLAKQIERLSSEIEEGLSRMRRMRECLPAEYHREFDVLVERGYMPMIDAKRTTIRGYERAAEEVQRQARDGSAGE